MAGNSFGKLFRISSFGESHGAGIGVVIDGCPSGLMVDLDLVTNDLAKRKPGQSAITTARKEDESFEVLSGIFEGKTTGMPIAIFVKNKDQKSKDYSHIKDQYRPSHADMVYDKKYGHRDYRGGGRSSARETVARVIAGSFAKMILAQHKIEIHAFVSQVGALKMDLNSEVTYANVETNVVRCPDPTLSTEMEALIKKVKKEGDTIGGQISCHILGCPIGLGEPVFDKLHADLAKAMLSINAVKGFEYGSGFNCIEMRGSQHNDLFTSTNDGISTKTNYSGGIQGGISNGMPITFNVAFKPVATIMRDQDSINKQGDKVKVQGKGRHDPCVVPRAVPIVEAMAALVIVDHLLMHKAYKS